MSDPVYKAAIDRDSKFYVDGPGLPGFDGGTLIPESRYDTEEEALRAVHACNAAYAAGHKVAVGTLRLFLEIDE